MPVLNNNSESDRIKKKNNTIVYSNFLKNTIAFSEGLLVRALPITSGSGANLSYSGLIQVNLGKVEIPLTTYELVISTSETKPNILPTPSTVPGIPTNLTLLSSGFTTATISFTPPNNGGSAITSYQYSLDSGISFTPVVLGQSPNTFTIYGLVSGTSYEIKIKAINIIGEGEPSDALLVIPGLPSFPANLSIDSTTATSATITFIAPNNGGSPIINYQYSLNAGVTYTSFSPPQISNILIIPGLTTGTTYQIRLRAVNGSGIGSSSSTIYVVPGIPLAPIRLYVVSTTSTTATIAFTSKDNGGSPITNYTVSLDGGNTFTPLDPPQTASPLVISGLTLATTYLLKIKAVNINGDGLASTTLSVTPGLPLVPLSVSLLSFTENYTGFNVSFAVNDSGGSDIIGYNFLLVGYSIYGGPYSYIINVSTTTSPLTILYSDINDEIIYSSIYYTIQLQAITENGNSAFSYPILGVSSTSNNIHNANNISPLTNVNLFSTTSSSAIISYKFPNIYNGFDAYYSDMSVSMDGGISYYYQHLYYTINKNTTYNINIGSYLSSKKLYSIALAIMSNNILFNTYTVLPFSIILGVPFAPTNLFISSITTSTATISFTAPSNTGGSDIIGYNYSIDGGANFSTASWSSPSTSITITGISVSLKYIIVLQAVNENGNGYLSSSFSLTGGVPSAPTNVYVSSTTSSTVTLSFTPPSDIGGSDITAYNYSLDSGANFSPANWSSPSTSITITGLSNSSTYNIVLQAVNVYGNGISSSSVSVIPGKASAPTNLSMYSSSLTSVTISFTPPTNVGSGITGYKYSLNGGPLLTATWTSGSSRVIISAGISNPSSITNSRTISRYIIYLVTSTSSGNSTNSSSIIVIPGAPTPPTNLSFSSLSRNRANINFTVGNNGGYTLLTYLYSLNGGNYVQLYPNAETSPIPIPVTPGNSYTISLKAMNNKYYISDASTTLSFTASLYSPDAPTGLSINSTTSTTATISFTAPDNGGSAITNYNISLDNGTTFTPLSPAQTGNSIVISGLTVATLYTVKIQAVNAIGSGTSSESLLVKPGVPIVMRSSDNFSIVFSTSYTQFYIPYRTGCVNNGGSPITNYSYSLDNGVTFTDCIPSQIEFNVAGSATCIRISGINTTNYYQFQVKGINANGISLSTSNYNLFKIGTNFDIVQVPPLYPDTTTSSHTATYFYACSGYADFTNLQYKINTRITDVSGYDITLSPTVTGIPLDTQYTFSLFIDNFTIPIKYTNADTNITSIETEPITLYSAFKPTNTRSSGTTLGWTNYFYNIIITGTATSNPFKKNGSIIKNYKYSYQLGSFTAFTPSLPIPAIGTSTSPIVFPNFTNTSITKIAILPVNGFGDGEFQKNESIVYNIPLSSPTGLSYVELSPTSVSISFTGPTATNYLYSLDNGNTYTALSPAQTTSPITITGLSVGIKYYVKLIALNSVGPGDPSSVLVIGQTIGQTNAFETKPTNLYIQDITTTDLVLANLFFTPISYNNYQMINYQYTTDGGATVILANFFDISNPNGIFASIYRLQSPIPIGLLSTGAALPRNSPITLQLQGLTSNGLTAFSDPITFTLGGTVPDPPTILSISYGNNTMYINFTEGSTHGGVITDYLYSIDEVSFQQAYQTTSPIIISQYTANTTFKLAAITTIGVSQTASFTIPDTPSAPTSLVATIIDPSTLSISFVINTYNNTITNYIYSLDDGATFQGFSPAQTSSPVIISNLVSGNTYQIKLYASTSVSSGQVSSTLTVVMN